MCLSQAGRFLEWTPQLLAVYVHGINIFKKHRKDLRNIAGEVFK